MMNQPRLNQEEKRRITLFQAGLAGGGAERVMLHLAEGLANSGYFVDLVVCHGNGPLRDEIPESVRLVDLGAHRIMASLPALVGYLRRERPGIMLSAMASTNCIAVWARALSRLSFRLVLSEHSTLSRASTGAVSVRSRLLPALMKRAYPRADMVVAVSKGVAADLAQTIGLSRDRIQVIYNPVVTPRLDALSREPVDHPWFQSGGAPVILGVGRLTRAKDFPTLIHAFARLRKYRKARLMILGEGEERESLERLVAELGVESEVALPGYVRNPYGYMRAAAMFVLSSRWEGLPTVLIEALACGTPTVSTNCPSGPEEILDGGRWGTLVPVGEAEALSKGMRLTLDNGRQGAEERQWRAKAFSDTVAVNQYISILTGC